MPSKKQIIIIVSVITLLAVMAFYFYKKGKNTVTLQSLPGELPGNNGSGNVLGASNDEIKRTANLLYQDMNGFNIWGHDYAGINAASVLNDNDLIKLYNTFNTTYQKESGETLTKWMDGEFWSYPDIPANIVLRLKKLNCL